MYRLTMISSLLVLALTSLWGGVAQAQDVSLHAIGIRGGINFNDIGLPPTEKEDFAQYDVFGVLNLPWRWDFSYGWEVSSRVTGTLGVLQGGGDTSFITTVTPGLAFHNPTWHFTLDLAIGGALLSDYTFGRQNIGGPFQFIAHGGLVFDLTDHIFGGYRFHHMSDGDIYGTNRGVELHMLELGYHF